MSQLQQSGVSDSGHIKGVSLGDHSKGVSVDVQINRFSIRGHIKGVSMSINTQSHQVTSQTTNTTGKKL